MPEVQEQTNQPQDGNAMLSEAIDKIKSGEVAKAEAPAESEEESTTEEPAEKRPAKNQKGFVEIEDPAIKARFDDVWKQARSSDENNKLLKNHQLQLEGALATAIGEIEKLKGRQNQNETQSAETDLKRQIKAARDIGNDDEVDRLNDLLTDLKVEKKIAARVQPAKPAQPQRTVSQPTVAASDIEYVNYLKDGGDGIKRPWLSRGDANFEKAQNEAAKIAEDHLFKKGKEMPIPMVMAELDKLMLKGGKNQSGANQGGSSAAVLSGANLTRRGGNSNIELGEDQKIAAKKLGISLDQYGKRMAMISRVKSVSIEDFN